jgi:4-amino-4-deoxy-L-arabinose transferase-like glycosyltransferase
MHPLALLTAILLLGFALRVAYLTADRFHADEALYAGWALLARDHDPLLLGVPVDKPPLYLYTLTGSLIAFGPSEVAARLPSLAASVLGIALVYRLGRRLYGRSVGLWAALFLALSPFDILFARTAFTDSMLVMWTLAALCAVAAGRWLAAGLLLGLAFATKQHAVLLIPLVAAVGWVQLPAPAAGRLGSTTKRLRHGTRGLLAGALGFALPFGLVTAWDAPRWAVRPGYWQQSAMSYGGLVWAPAAEWGERLVEWLGWARYLAGTPVLGIMLIAGCAALLVYGWRNHPRTRQTWLDTTFVVYAIGYLAVHAILGFSIWDRYLLPLAPLVGLILGRIVVWTSRTVGRESDQRRQETTATVSPSILHALRVRIVQSGVVPLFLSLSLLSGWKAAGNGYPVGGEHWAYQGLDQVVAYLQENAPPDAVLYHHWLRWHYSYYLYDTEFELRWWQSGEHLQREATRSPERAQYIVLPDWRTQEPDAEGIQLQPVYETRRQDGSVSLHVYRVEPVQLASEAKREEGGAE